MAKKLPKSRLRINSAKRKPMERGPNPKVVESHPLAIAKLNAAQREKFDLTMQRIRSLTRKTPKAEVGALLAEMLHWAIPPIVKIYLFKEMNRRMTWIDR